MREYFDSLGNKLETGDLMIEVGVRWPEVETMKATYRYFIIVYEVPEIKDGRGICYKNNGDRTHFYYVDFLRSVKVNREFLPEGFEYSFKHGMIYLLCKIQDGTYHELIENSDWKTKEVKRPKLISKKYKQLRDAVKEYMENDQSIKSLMFLNNHDMLNQEELLERARRLPNTCRIITEGGEAIVLVDGDKMEKETKEGTVDEDGWTTFYGMKWKTGTSIMKDKKAYDLLVNMATKNQEFTNDLATLSSMIQAENTKTPEIFARKVINRILKESGYCPAHVKQYFDDIFSLRKDTLEPPKEKEKN